MIEINVYYDPMGNTLTVWFGDQKLKKFITNYNHSLS